MSKIRMNTEFRNKILNRYVESAEEEITQEKSFNVTSFVVLNSLPAESYNLFTEFCETINVSLPLGVPFKLIPSTYVLLEFETWIEEGVLEERTATPPEIEKLKLFMVGVPEPLTLV